MENNFLGNERDELLRLLFFTCVSAIIFAAIILLHKCNSSDIEVIINVDRAMELLTNKD